MNQRLVSFRLGEVKDYADILEMLLAREARDLESRANALPETMTPEEREEYWEYHAEFYQSVAEHIPNHLRYGLILSTYAAFEEEVMRLTKLFMKSVTSALTDRDLRKPGGLERAKKFLSKDVQLEIGAGKWEAIDPYRLARNAIAHLGRWVDVDDQRNEPLTPFIAGNECISLDDHRYLVISRGFLDQFLKVIQEFFDEFFRAWKTWATTRVVK